MDRIPEQVAAGRVRSRAFDKAKEQAEMVVAKVKAGLPLRHVLADAKLPAPQPVTNRRIDVASQGERIPPPLAMMFTMPADAVRTLAAPGEQGWFVVKVVEVKKGALRTRSEEHTSELQ